MVVLNVWKNLTLVYLGIVIVCLGGCIKKPTNLQLEVWRKEASDSEALLQAVRNAEILADKAKNNSQRQWNLVIQGETKDGKSKTLNWTELLKLATTNVNTIDANNIITPNQVFKFQGIPVSTLLKNFGVPPEVTEITFVCYDAYQVTVKIQDLLTYPIILALAKDDKPIQRDQGGPLYLIFPYTEYPQIRQKYNEGSWAFYVTHVIFGTEKALVRVGERELNLAALDKLPQVTLNQNVGYRVWWPSSKVKLHGVRVRDVLSLAGIKPQSSVIVTGKPAIYRRNSEPTELASTDINNCNVILATRWGENKQPILAKMGGPVTLAFGNDCPSKTKNKRWVTFVEELTPQI
ncbi:molybdopterin-dependent oxidoreductase [Anabaena sp. UHCC 0204]|uniref:molybdopterin-dependent oxidoreductase n=1 Tax=Anabaena sp. UHCC 0204 TaxID=2590009 RepID=UPI0014460409|nr:molybdopterin-dependent oxidoreductase [Anabaena sp. UHCC 0204]